MKVSFPEHHLIQLLKRFEGQHLPLDLFLSQYFREHHALGSKDRQIIAEAVYGMSRWKGLLDHLIGTYPTWEKRYALFQDFQPAHYFTSASIPPHIRVSFPKALFDLLETNYGLDKALDICRLSNTEAPLTIRVNPLKITRPELLSRWQGLHDAIPCAHSAYGIQLKKRIPLVALSEFKEGFFEIQDEASQLIAALVEAEPGQHVLDYCAGSGGKSLAFAHRLAKKGQIYLHDIRPAILAQARKRLKRADIQNVQPLPAGHANLKKLRKKMDWTLVDAPCTGTGTLRRNPDQKWKFSSDLLNRLLGEQRTIFERALSYVKPGGKIIYATCSMLAQENEQQVEHFLKTYDLKLTQPIFSSLPAPGSMDGMFAAVFTT